MTFTEIGKILDRKYGQSQMGKKVTASLVCETFDKMILDIWGKKMENMGQAMYLKNKVLTVAVLSPVVAGELKMRESELVDKLNSKFGQGAVDRLRFLT